MNPPSSSNEPKADGLDSQILRSSSLSLSSTTISGLDSTQLLTTCQRIRENMSSMDKGVEMTQLRLRALSCVRQSDVEDATLKCLDELIELCNLSRLLIKQLEELHQKLIESEENPINYQIASQQLMYFTAEWHERLTPKLNETFELALRQDIDVRFIGSRSSALSDQQQQQLSTLGSTDIRVRDALLRLRQSMGENERLIATIASNIDFTRATIEAIFDSLRTAELGAGSGKQSALLAVAELRRQQRQAIMWYAVGALVLVLLLAYAIYVLLRTLL